MTRKLIASALFTCTMALAVGTASSQARVVHQGHTEPSCMREHPGAGKYCRAVMHRKAIKIVRRRVAAEAARAQVKVHVSNHLGWNVSSLWRTNHWERHRLRYLQSLPTPIPGRAEWMCILQYESTGDWTMAPPASGGPYWGGLQMDVNFMHTYGSDMIARHHGGYANTWTPEEQMIVANRARLGWRGNRGRGWQPWPQTSLMCGLSY